MKSLVVSIHDVSPVTRPICDRILEELAGLGIERTSLLVIPNYHHSAPVADDREFRAWLVRRVQCGHEPVLHGYYHQRQRAQTESLLSRVTNEVYTAGEGEFFDLSFEEATNRLKRGLADLSFVPVNIAGFIAPAWLLGTEAERAVRQCGFLYTTRIGSMIGLKNGSDIVSRSLVWSTRATWRIAASLAWNRGLSWTLRDGPVVRIGIHPPDYQHATVWKQIVKLLRELSPGRHAASYRDLMDSRL
jgi:predicted deacetylase